MIKGLSGCLGRAAFVAVAGWLLLLIAACGGGGEPEASRGDAGQPDAVAAQGDELPTEEIPTRWAYGNASDLPSLIETSDEIFLGRVTGVLGQHPAAAPGGREGVPLTSFEVTVETVLTGGLSPGATVEIEQAGGVLEAPDGARTRVVLEGDKLLENGAQYLFFADYKVNGKLSVPPFGRLQVGFDGALQPLAAWSELGALKQLTGLSASRAAARVGEAH